MWVADEYYSSFDINILTNQYQSCHNSNSMKIIKSHILENHENHENHKFLKFMKSTHIAQFHENAHSWKSWKSKSVKSVKKFEKLQKYFVFHLFWSNKYLENMVSKLFKGGTEKKLEKREKFENHENS